jgi:GLPGLI family protein
MSAQIKAGIIKYKHKVFIEFENMPADMPKSVDTYTRLVFNGNESLYEKDPDVKVDVDVNDNTPRMFRRMRMTPAKTTYKNTDKSLSLEALNLFGKDFLITDSIENIKWKVIATEQKVVAGYTCMKAMYSDTASNIVVYFSPQIPKKFGPDKYGNLPGIILEVQSANFHIIATEIKTDNTVTVTAPNKGSKMTRKEFEKLREEKTKEMREMMGRGGSERRFPRQ